jgi:hypothetical protein
MSRKPKTNRKAKDGGRRDRPKSIDALLLKLGRADLVTALRSKYAGQIGLAAILLARREVADLADRLDRILREALTRIEQHAADPPTRPRPGA